MLGAAVPVVVPRPSALSSGRDPLRAVLALFGLPTADGFPDRPASCRLDAAGELDCPKALAPPSPTVNVSANTKIDHFIRNASGSAPATFDLLGSSYRCFES